MPNKTKKKKQQKAGQKLQTNPHDVWTCKHSKFQMGDQTKDTYLYPASYCGSQSNRSFISIESYRREQTKFWCQYSRQAKDSYNHVACSRPMYIVEPETIQLVKLFIYLISNNFKPRV